MRQLGKKLYKLWMSFAKRLAIVNTTILLSIVYVFLIGFGALIIKLIRKDLLKHRFGKTNSYWQSKTPVEHTIEQARHQF